MAAKTRTIPTSPAPPKKAAGKAHDVNEPQHRVVAQNRRARHEFEILETFECGIALRGGEVKSLRARQVSLQDSYARIDRGELWLLNMRIAAYEYSNGFGYVEPDRARKLLIHRAQIDQLQGRVAQQALTLVPLSVYFSDGLAKVELALARGKKLYDKRHALAERDANREAQRVIKSYEQR